MLLQKELSFLQAELSNSPHFLKDVTHFNPKAAYSSNKTKFSLLLMIIIQMRRKYS